VNQAITQMDEVTQQNAALVEEAAAAGRNPLERAGAEPGQRGIGVQAGHVKRRQFDARGGSGVC